MPGSSSARARAAPRSGASATGASIGGSAAASSPGAWPGDGRRRARDPGRQRGERLQDPGAVLVRRDAEHQREPRARGSGARSEAARAAAPPGIVGAVEDERWAARRRPGCTWKRPGQRTLGAARPDRGLGHRQARRLGEDPDGADRQRGVGRLEERRAARAGRRRSAQPGPAQAEPVAARGRSRAPRRASSRPSDEERHPDGPAARLDDRHGLRRLGGRAGPCRPG